MDPIKEESLFPYLTMHLHLGNWLTRRFVEMFSGI